MGDTEVLNYSNIARECGVSAPTVRSYFEILQDTLLGRFLPAHVRRAKRRVTHAPKFYFADVGVVNELARRGRLEQGGELYGKALESWVFHELSAYRAYSEEWFDLAYWKLSGGTEVDFVIGDAAVAIEVKATTRVASHHLKGLREMAADYPGIRKRILGVSRAPTSPHGGGNRRSPGRGVQPSPVGWRDLCLSADRRAHWSSLDDRGQVCSLQC